MTYELNGKEFKLRNVCGKSLKICKELGLLQRGERISKEEQDLILEALDKKEDGLVWKAQQVFERKPAIDEMEIYLNYEKLIRLIDAVFLISKEDLDELTKVAEELNTEVVIQGAFDFLGKCQPSSSRSEELLKTFVASIAEMKTAQSAN